MPLGLILLGIGILFLSYRAIMRQSAATRERLARVVLGLGGVALVILLIRVGMPWLALIGTAVWAGLRFVTPIVLRLLPFLLPRWVGPHRASAEESGAGATGKRGAANMTRSEALDVLGLREGATEDEIVHAYRELIKKVHPDRGGSAHLASQVNRARDLLLSERDTPPACP